MNSALEIRAVRVLTRIATLHHGRDAIARRVLNAEALGVDLRAACDEVGRRGARVNLGIAVVVGASFATGEEHAGVVIEHVTATRLKRLPFFDAEVDQVPKLAAIHRMRTEVVPGAVRATECDATRVGTFGVVQTLGEDLFAFLALGNFRKERVAGEACVGDHHFFAEVEIAGAATIDEPVFKVIVWRLFVRAITLETFRRSAFVACAAGDASIDIRAYDLGAVRIHRRTERVAHPVTVKTGLLA